MPESPRDRMKRQPNRLRSPHAGQSLEPSLTRQGLLAHPGSLAMCFAALIFFAYVFNMAGLQTWMDASLSGLDAEARSHNNDVATWFVRALPYFGMAVLAIFSFLVLSKMGAGPGRISKASPESGRPGRTSLEEFVKAAAECQVSERVAREAYSLLAPRYGKAAISLSDSLMKRLGLTPDRISDMQGTLMRYTDRQIKPGDAGAAVETVLELLVAVETSTVRSASQPEASPAMVARSGRPDQQEQSVGQVAASPAAAAKPAFIRPYRPEVARASETPG